MAFEFRMQRLVEFVDTDMAGILHFSNFFRYMEAVEHTFFRSLGLSVHPHADSGIWGWARGRADCTFKQPLRYEDVVELHLLVREIRSKSITYDIVFRKLAGDDSVEVARGSMSVVCVSKVPGEDAIRATPIPDEIAALIDVAPAELLA